MNVRRTVMTAWVLALGVLAFAGSASAGADVVREQFVIQVAGQVEEGCDEPILLTGGHVVETIQLFTDANGRGHALFHFQTHGLVGVGLDSGATYRDQSHLTQHGIGSIEEGFSTGGFTFHVRIRSNDPDVQDLVLRESFTIVKRDGVNRVYRFASTMSCD